MKSSSLTFSKWKFSTAILILALITVSFVSLYQLQAQPYVPATPSFIDVTIEGKDKLGVNETSQYTAVINSQVSSQLSISWTVTPEDNKVRLQVDGDKCSLTFLEATQEPYLLSVSVKDLVRGNLGSASKTIYDPYTSPALYLGSTGASYSFLIETDGLGWYRAVNGSDGSIAWSSTNATTIIQNTIIDDTTVYLKNGVYDDVVLSFSGIENFVLTGDKNAVLYTTLSSNIIAITGSSNIVIKGIHLQGDATGEKSQTAIVSHTSSNIEVSDCIIDHIGYDGITLLYGCSGCKILNNYISYCYDDAINPGGGGGNPGTSDTLVMGNYITNILHDGVHLSDLSYGSKVIGNTMINCGYGVGIYNSSGNIISENKILNCTSGIKTYTGTCDKQKIVNNFINVTTTGAGIDLEHSPHNCDISGNTILNPATYGIANINGENVTISNNIITGGTRGIFTYPKNHLITNNLLIEPSQYGIVISGASNGYGNSTVSGNKIYGGSLNGAIYINANYTFVSGNQITAVTGSNAIAEISPSNWNVIVNNAYPSGKLINTSGANTTSTSNYVIP